MLTPQAIKDQEFQVKFRGYDTIEVRSFLELLADDFFELLEQNRAHAEEITSLIAAQELLQVEKERFENELQMSQVSRTEIETEIQEEYRQKDEESGIFKDQIEELKTTVSQLEEENSAHREQIVELQGKLRSEREVIEKERSQVAKLQDKLERVEERKKELEKEGLDFKTTILAAQSFADNLRASSEREAQAALEQAKAEVEKIRNEAREELLQLPKKIEELRQKKKQVRNELKAILVKYMEGLETTVDDDAGINDDDFSELFQRIQLPDDENADLDDNPADRNSF